MGHTHDTTRQALEIRSHQQTSDGSERAQLKQGLTGMPIQHQRAAMRPPRPVQFSASSTKGAANVHKTAGEGLSGSASSLPHLGSIQHSFGRHDVSGVNAFVGGAAATANDKMGSLAYATGNNVAFKQTPDLHTAAHEAAHVVQQRAGAVQCKDGVGEVGDRYEQHADAVADAVVQGRSAEGILDQMAGGAGGSAVQHQTDLADAPIQYYRAGGSDPQDSPAIHGWRVGENNETAVSQETEEGGYNLFSTANNITQANQALTAAQSGIILDQVKGSTVAGGTTLVEVRPMLNPKFATPHDDKLKDVNAGRQADDTGTTRNDKLGLWTDCGRASRVVTGGLVGANYETAGGDAQTKASGNPETFSDEIYLKTMPEFLADPNNMQYLIEGVHYTADTPNYPALAAKVHNAMKGWGTDEKAVYSALGELNHDIDRVSEFKRVYKETYGSTVEADIRGDFSGDEQRKALTLLEGRSKTPAKITPINPTTAAEARAQFAQLQKNGAEAYAFQFGINEYANPEIGETYTMVTEFDMPGFESSDFTWNFHWAGVIMKDGSDNVTLEGYAINPAEKLRKAREDYKQHRDRGRYEDEVQRIREWAANFIDRDYRIQMYGTKVAYESFHAEHARSNTHGSHQSSFAAGKKDP